MVIYFVRHGFPNYETDRLTELGYGREGEYYRVTGEDTDKVVAMFSHVGSMRREGLYIPR